jgi:hypothetical protein
MYNWDIFIWKIIIPKEDRALKKLNYFTNTEKAAYFYSRRKFLDEGLEKKGDLDLISWITFANLFKDEPEMAYHAYYIAHLMDHQKIKANSDLVFNIGIEDEDKRSIEEKNIDKILRNIQ